MSHQHPMWNFIKFSFLSEKQMQDVFYISGYLFWSIQLSFQWRQKNTLVFKEFFWISE